MHLTCPCSLKLSDLHFSFLPTLHQTPLELSSDGSFTSSEFGEPEAKLKPFPYPLPMDPAQQTLSSIPLALFYPLILAGIAGVAQLGLLAGRSLPGKDHRAKHETSVQTLQFWGVKQTHMASC